MAVTYPLEGADAVLYSIDAFYTDLIAMMRTATQSTGSCLPYSHQIALSNTPLNVTAQGAAARKMRAGLREWTANIAARYPAVNRDIGARSVLTVGGTARSFVQSGRLSIRFPAFDITSSTSAAISTDAATWKYFRPSKLVEWDASFECEVDQGTAMTIPESSNTALSSYTSFSLKLCEDGAADPTLAGVAFINSQNHDSDTSTPGPQRLSYQMTGTDGITPTNGSNLSAIFGGSGSVIPIPLWDTTKNLVWYADSVAPRTWTGSAFWESVEFTWQMDQPLEVRFGLRGTGPLTPA